MTEGDKNFTALLPGQKYKVILLRSKGSDLAYLAEQIGLGKIRSVIDRTYPLSDIAAAYEYSEAEHTIGKIVITI